MKKINANYFIRHVEFGGLIETFFLMAVVSLLSLRAGLFVFDYPQIGSETLHIAHVLWGGLLMFFGLMCGMTLLNKEGRYMAAVLGGAGFGVFIDELGKFVTHDNNYFYQPTFALIYVIMMFLFLLLRTIERAIPPSPQEYLVNAMELVKDAVVHDLDQDEQEMALALLKKADLDEPLAKHLKQFIAKIEAIPPKPKTQWQSWMEKLKDTYRQVIVNPYFSQVVILYFALMAVFSLIVSVLFVDATGFWIGGLRLSALAMTILVTVGSFLLYRKRRREGYEWYRYAVIVAILFFQFFLMYFQPFIAIILLVIYLLTLVVLNYALMREELESVKPKRFDVYSWFRSSLKIFVVRK